MYFNSWQVSVHASANRWHTQCMLSSLLFLCLSFAGTPLFFHTIILAPSVDRPISLLISKLQAAKSFLTSSVMASESQLAKSSSTFWEDRNTVVTDEFSCSQNWINEISWEDTVMSVTSSISNPKLLAFLAFFKRVCFTASSETQGQIVGGSSRRSLLFFVPYFPPRLDFPSPPLSAPGSPRMVLRCHQGSSRFL